MRVYSCRAAAYAGDVPTRVELLLNTQASGATRLNANEATLVLYNCSARRSCVSCTAEVDAGASCYWVPTEQRCVFSQHHNEYLMRAVDSAFYYSSSLWITASASCPALVLSPSSNVLLKRGRRDGVVVALPSDTPFDLQLVIHNARAEWGASPFAEHHSCRVALADAAVGQFEATIHASTRCVKQDTCLEFALPRVSLAGLPPALVDRGLQCQRRLGPNELSSDYSSPIFAPCRQANESLSLRITCTYQQFALDPKFFDYDFTQTVSCTFTYPTGNLSVIDASSKSTCDQYSLCNPFFRVPIHLLLLEDLHRMSARLFSRL